MTKKSKQPPIGWTTEAEVVRVIDGDTIEVEIKRTFKIRLLDPNNQNNKLFGAQEHDTAKGVKAKEYLEKLLTETVVDGPTETQVYKNVVVNIPTHNPLRMLDVYTFDRMLGNIWLKDSGKNVSELMLDSGFASHNQKEERKTNGS